jgi:phage gpG-like protein
VADPAVRLEGFKEFRRDLKRLEPEAEKALRKDIKAAAGKVAVAAAASASVFARTGKYAKSIRPYVTARGASVGSRLPQAGVLHFGGTIRPRGVAITFPARPVVGEALDRQTDRIVEEVGDAIEQAAIRAGWHR